eukprot:6054729-Amphidinium_carterae.1
MPTFFAMKELESNLSAAASALQLSLHHCQHRREIERPLFTPPGESLRLPTCISGENGAIEFSFQDSEILSGICFEECGVLGKALTK